MGFPVSPPLTYLLLCLLGCAVGAFGTLVGAGGGFLLMPLLAVIYPGRKRGSAHQYFACSCCVLNGNLRIVLGLRKNGPD